MLKKRGLNNSAYAGGNDGGICFLSDCGGADSGSSQTRQSAERQYGKVQGKCRQRYRIAGKTKITMITYLGNPTRDALIQEMVAGLDNIELKSFLPGGSGHAENFNHASGRRGY